MARGAKIEGGLSGLKPSSNNKNEPKPKSHSNQKKGEVKTSLPNMKVPKDTQEALKDFKEIDNFHLKLNQFARFEEGKPIFFKSTKGKVDFSIVPNFGDFNFKDNLTKQEQIIKALFGENYHEKDLTTSYRLVIGGEVTVYETSMRLHHIYGIPYIPASGIKGVVRSYIITEKFATELENYKDRYTKFEEEVLFAKDEKGEYIEKEFVDIFGSQDKTGKVTFFDAFPTDKPNLKVDIMNPHYGDYYSKKEAPTDTKNPVPINFLTVEDTKFRFMIGAKEELNSFIIKDKEEKDKTIETWLTEALQNHGLGAKTAVGYGYFGG